MEKLIKRRVGLAFQAKLPAIVLGKIIDQVKLQTRPVPKKGSGFFTGQIIYSIIWICPEQRIA
jgi:hypothetical protein